MSQEIVLRSYKRIGNHLKQELRNGVYQIGERLPPERDIAERFGVSRTVIREALIMLELEELVTVKKGSGVYVIAFPQEQGGMEELSSSGMLTDIGPFELLQARQLLESGIAEFAAIQATRSDVLSLRQTLKKEREQLKTGDHSYEADKAFHCGIAKITQNEVLIKMQEELWEYRTNSPMWKALHAHISNFDYRHFWLNDHEQILNAIQRKDPALARKTMWQHLENVKQKIFELSDIDDPNFDGYLFNTSPVVVGIA